MPTEQPITNNVITVLVSYEKKKKVYYSNLKIRDVKDNRTFWRKIKSLFSGKVKLQTNTLLMEKQNDLSDPEISSEVKKVISDDMER